MGGSYWTLSGKRLPYMRDKTRDSRFFVLTLFAIGRELERRGSLLPFKQIDLAVGLPPEHYGMLREKFAQYFRRGVVKFTYKEQPIHLDIRRVLVYPQAYAAVIPQSGQLLKTPRVFIVDIGGFTTDVLLLRNGNPDLQFCRSLESGVITMDNAIIGKVNAQYDMMVDDELISDVLLGRETILPQEVKQTIQEAAKTHAKDILDQLRELGVDLRTNPAIFIGGAASLFRPCWTDSPWWPQGGSVVGDPKANAIGYEMLAATTLRLDEEGSGGLPVQPAVSRRHPGAYPSRGGAGATGKTEKQPGSSGLGGISGPAPPVGNPGGARQDRTTVRYEPGKAGRTGAAAGGGEAGLIAGLQSGSRSRRGGRARFGHLPDAGELGAFSKLG